MVSAAIPKNTIVNADDLGLNQSVNLAILKCFKLGLINSASLLTNLAGFDEAVEMIKRNPCMQNIGIHVNLAEGKPVIFNDPEFLDENGCWNLKRTNKAAMILTRQNKNNFLQEIRAQINKTRDTDLLFTHIDSHYHLHTLPAFFPLFLQVAKEYNLKLRLAQTYNEGDYAKYLYRKWINSRVKKDRLNYADYFETVSIYLKNKSFARSNNLIEVMIHPDLFNDTIIDHVDRQAMQLWINYLQP